VRGGQSCLEPARGKDGRTEQRGNGGGREISNGNKMTLNIWWTEPTDGKE
jgi:hypothetical protein